jgi:DedD protein
VLREKLQKAGIKAYTETRLHVGPFKDRAEAEQALVRLRELGVKGVVVPQR